MITTLTVCNQKIIINGRLLRIARIDGEKYRYFEHPETLVAGIQKCDERIDIFTFLQRLPVTTPKYNYPMEWDNLAVLSVTNFDHWWTQILGFKGRNKAKQAEKKGVIVRECDFDNRLVEGIEAIYNECPIRQGKRFPYFGMSRERVREYAGTFLDCSIFLGAYLGNVLIGFAKLTIDESNSQAGLMHIVSMIEHRDKAPTNALIAQAVRSCAERNIPYLVYSNFAYGNKQRDSLSDFKERNGFTRVNVPRYYVPVTRLGGLAFNMGMHHKLIDRIPEPIIAKLRNYRAQWYNLHQDSPALVK